MTEKNEDMYCYELDLNEGYHLDDLYLEIYKNDGYYCTIMRQNPSSEECPKIITQAYLPINFDIKNLKNGKDVGKQRKLIHNSPQPHKEGMTGFICGNQFFKRNS